MRTKYITPYSTFLLEQDMMGGVPGAPGAPGAPAPKVERYKFIFLSNLDDSSISSRKYPDGSVIVKYPCYSITMPELEEWSAKNVISTAKLELNPSEVEVRKKNISNIVKGDKVNVTKDDKLFIEKLKNAIASNIIGKKEVEIEVIYPNDKVPTTEHIDVTFIKLPEK